MAASCSAALHLNLHKRLLGTGGIREALLFGAVPSGGPRTRSPRLPTSRPSRLIVSRIRYLQRSKWEMGKTRPAGPAAPEGIRGCRCPEHCRGRVRSCVRIRVCVHARSHTCARVPVRVCARACRRTSVSACACVEEGRRSRAPQGMDVLLAGSVVVGRHHSIRPLGQPAISTPCHLQVRVASAVSDEKQPRSFAEPSPSAVTYMSAGGHPVRVIAGSDDEAWQESNPLRPRPAPRKGLKCAQVASTLPRPPAPHLRVGSSDRPRPVLA